MAKKNAKTPVNENAPETTKPARAPKRACKAAPRVDAAPEHAPERVPVASSLLLDVFAGYMGTLTIEGKSGTTLSSYRAELETAGEALGLDADVTKLTPDRVREYFESDLVTRKRNGKPKSPLSIDKTRRVLRQALVWAAKQGLIEKAPLPEDPATATAG